MDLEVVNGPRKRKKRVRYGDEDWDSENQPPSNIAKTEKESIFLKAESATDNQPSVVLGRVPLGVSNAAEAPEASGPVIDASPPIALEKGKAFMEDNEVAPVWERPPGVGMPGQLKSITLVNFMCHEHLQMEFGPHVNFISGQNGSGKSAMLQAIQQVLGVKARETGRATGQQAFIKANCHEARVSITLWNEGAEAYLPNVYGKEIIIDRRIGKTASISIKTSSGRKVGHRRDELDAILDALQINAANPITVMTQDTTRSFMDGGTGKRDRQKYGIYMEATMLDRIAEANQNSSSALKTMNAEVMSEAEKHRILVKEMKALEAAVESLKELDEAKAEESVLQQALSWAAVISTRAEIKRLEQQLDVSAPQARSLAETEMEEAMAQLKQLENNVAQQNEALSTYSGDLEALSDEIRALKKEEAGAREAVRKMGNKINRFQTDARNTQISEDEPVPEYITKAAKLQVIMSAMRDQEAELYAQNEEANKRFQAAEAEILAQQTAAESEISKCKANMLAFSKLTVQLQQELSATRSKREAAECYLRFQEKQVEKWTRYAKEELRFGGERSERLVKAIHADPFRFHKLPVGPVGDMLSIRDSKWAQPVEQCLGRALKNFLVHDTHDYHQLRDLCQSEGLTFPPCMIVKLDGKRHSVDAGLPPDHVLTMYHELSCSDANLSTAVMNSLVDQAALENQALVFEKEELSSIAECENVISAWLTDGSVLRNERTSSTYYPLPRACKQPRLGTNADETLKLLHIKLNAARTEYLDAKRAHEEIEERLKSHKRLRGGLRDAIVEAKNLQRSITDELAMLHEEHDVGATGNSELAQELETAQWKTKEAKTKLLKAEAKHNVLIEIQAEVERKVEEARHRLDNFESEHMRMLEEKAGQEEAVQAATAKVTAVEEFGENLDGKVEKLSTMKIEAEKSLDEQITKANEVCDEETGMKALNNSQAELASKQIPAADLTADLIPAILSKKLQRLQQKISRQEASAGGMKVELQAKLRKLERRVNVSRRSLEALTSAYELLKDGMDMRQAQYDSMEKTVEETVNRKFNYFLNKKGHNGSIKVNKSFIQDPSNDSVYDTSTLEIRVIIDSSKDKGKVRDLKQLSGGERSFTTVAFSLALGEYSGSPFRAMDEFDVFMDAINRQTSLESLLNNGLEHKDLQFIFLTPLDISAVEGAKNKIRERGMEIAKDFVKIVKLQPARG